MDMKVLQCDYNLPKVEAMYEGTDYSSPNEVQLSECSTLTSPLESDMTTSPRWEFKHFEMTRPRLAILQPNYQREQVQSPADSSHSRIEKRKEQNRLSQRKFRERKEEKLRKAGDEVAELQDLVRSLQRRVVELETVNLQLRGTLSSIGSLCCNGPSPLLFDQMGLLDENTGSELSNHLIPFQTALEDLDLQAQLVNDLQSRHLRHSIS